MIIRRDLVIAVLLTFCLSATLFSVISTKSQYDPWIDMNDDGAIDSTDLGMLGNGWGAFGDPTKNVSVTNWPSPKGQYEMVKVGSVNFTSDMDDCYFFDIYVGGYSRMAFLVEITNASSWGSNRMYFGVECVLWFKEPGTQYNAAVYEYMNAFNFTVEYYSPQMIYEYVHDPMLLETKAPYCGFNLRQFGSFYTPWWITMDFYLYLRNE